PQGSRRPPCGGMIPRAALPRSPVRDALARRTRTATLMEQPSLARVTSMAQTPLTLRRWTRKEYDRLVDLGVFEGEPLELLGGQLIVAEPKGTYHSSAVSAADYALRAVLPAGWIVRTQAAVSFDDESEPEPDLVVVPGRPADYRHAHPQRTALAVEVSDSSLRFDPRSTDGGTGQSRR